MLGLQITSSVGTTCLTERTALRHVICLNTNMFPLYFPDTAETHHVGGRRTCTPQTTHTYLFNSIHSHPLSYNHMLAITVLTSTTSLVWPCPSINFTEKHVSGAGIVACSLFLIRLSGALLAWGRQASRIFCIVAIHGSVHRVCVGQAMPVVVVLRILNWVQQVRR